MVLIACDNRDAADAIGLLLPDERCATVVATDASEVVRRVIESRPAVVVLGGPASWNERACRELKADEAAHSSLVLAVTKLEDLTSIERIVAAGADDFLSTPIEPAELRKRLENLLTLH